MELKKTFDEKTAAISSKNAAELTLRRIYASQKDPTLPQLEQIIAPLEAEIKLKNKDVRRKPRSALVALCATLKLSMFFSVMVARVPQISITFWSTVSLLVCQRTVTVSVTLFFRLYNFVVAPYL